MLYIIAGIIIIFIAVRLIKKIGGFALKLLRGLFAFIKKAIYLVTAGPAVLCSKVFYGITKKLHLQGFIYYLLGLFSIPSFIYLCAIHIPYSKKEKFIDSEEFFVPKKKIRHNNIAMACFLSFEGVLFLYLPSIKKMEEDEVSVLLFLGVVYIISAFIYAFVKILKWKKDNEFIYDRYTEWRKWTQNEAASISESAIEEKVISESVKFSDADTNTNKFTVDDMPYGRATAFISYFNKNLDDEEPIYFSPRMSPDENELREYGTLVTSKGVYISEHEKDDIEIPFEGLWDVVHTEKECFFDYGLLTGEEFIVRIQKSASSINVNTLSEFLRSLNDISLAMIQEKVVTELDEAFEAYEKVSVSDAEKKFDIEQRIDGISNAVEIGGIGVGLKQNAHIYNDEVKYTMNGARGGGYAAEYGNNAIDRLMFKDAKNLAQELDEHGRQVKDGADRSVNGVNIQSKYGFNASQSIGDAFEKKHARYLNPDGTMMQIEVPRDQYNEAVREMQRRIRLGQVPGESNPENAKKYVRKGHWTYFQANNIALAGSIEGIAADVSQGVVCSLPGAGITFVLSFASAVWNGQDIKEAARQSTLYGLKVVGKSAAIYTLTMQLSRDKIVNIFAPKIMAGESGKQVKRSFGYVNNHVFTGAEKVAKKISSSGLAKSKLGKAVKLDKVNGRQLISGSVTAVVVYGPDICRAFSGKISGKQLFKNSAVSTAGLVGATIGTAIPIPVVGTMLGGALGSFVAKKVLDNFIEDDSVAQFRIMREEFLDIVMLFSFSKDEFDEILEATIANSSLPQILQAMYQSGTPKDYADALINAEVQYVLSKREKITNEKIEEGMQLLLEDKTEEEKVS